MENKEKIKLTLSLLALAATSIFTIFAAFCRRRRRHQTSQNQCYLETDQSKPQTLFKRVLSDNSYTPFKHLDRNATSLRRVLVNLNFSLKQPSNSHPYEDKILKIWASEEGFGFVDGDVDFEMKGSCVWVGRRDQLVKLKGVLSKERLFGVATEQHTLRSFLGFTALMQISTRSVDYLVDTIALHDVMSILQPVFANPKICKVFHGADNDVIWLQRDFHIYVVNIFDTAKACQVLSKPQKSLAYLLENYCGVATSKKLQLKDWRLRPLEEEMIQYARANSHYLLYIADCLATELKFRSTENSEHYENEFQFFHETIRCSNTIALQCYTKEIEASPGNCAAASILLHCLNGQGGDTLNFETKELVERLCMWRDIMARVHDESLRYVLSDRAIVALASKDPTTAEEIHDIISEADLSSDSPTVDSLLPSPSPIVCSHLDDVCDLLAEKISNMGDFFETIIQKHLGPSGTCPLLIHNYALLTNLNMNVTNGLFAKKSVKGPKQLDREASRQLFVQKFSGKSPVYHNSRTYTSDGQLLCYCDHRKLEWCLRQDLAKLVDNDPLAIMLPFEPKGCPEDGDNDFYIQSKQNLCVGCGETNHYLHYQIIPSCYTVHFPDHLKSHCSHDIILLCVNCHEIAHSDAEKHKRWIEAEFGFPLIIKRIVDSRRTEGFDGASGSGENAEEAGMSSPLHLRTAATTLLCYGSDMPIKHQKELTQIVVKFSGGRKISEEDPERALVGMSLHERRPLGKEREFSFKHFSGNDLLSKANNDADCMNTSALPEAMECDLNNCSQPAREGMSMHSKHEDENLHMKVNKSCDSVIKGKTSATDGITMEFNLISTSAKGNVLGIDEYIENSTVSDDRSGYSQHKTDGMASPTSLLGHVPHGKQVVDHLLKEYGEDGIRVFCENWRQVFVESFNPRFLPSGRDVMHRGSQDFSD